MAAWCCTSGCSLAAARGRAWPEADELRIDIAPVLLGGGIRLFGELRNEPIHLEQIKVTSSKAVTHLRYRVLPGNAAGQR